MPDEPTDSLAHDELAVWIRRHPEVWHFADELEPPIDQAWTERTIRDIESGARQQRRRARRRRRVIAAGAVLAMLAAGGTAAAIATRSGQPAAPEAGVFCRAEPLILTHTVQLAPGSDPIADCRTEWDTGSFAHRVTSGRVPDLVACIDPLGGAINVFPGDQAVCADLGMAVADAALDAESEVVLTLQARLVEAINAAECAPAAEVAERSQSILDESGLSGWRVQMNADPASSVCAKVGVDSPNQTVFVSEF